MSDKTQTETPATLSDEDITTSRHVTRRSLLNSTRVAVGFGAAALLFGSMISRAHAESDKANTYDDDRGDRRPTTDND